MRPVIGIDFDNTLVTYDQVLQEEAVRQGLLDPNEAIGKRRIRDRIRQLPDGEIKWRRLQSIVYGQRMEEAHLAEGAEEFLHRCRQEGIPVFVVSHKTEYPAEGEQVNLREVAWNWMHRRGFFSEEGLGLRPENVSFHGTRAEKIERIRQVGCTHFVDDLEETFLEPSFPTSVLKILYAPHQEGVPAPGVRLIRRWQEVTVPDLGNLLKEPAVSWESLGGGRNSQVYRVELAGNRSYVVKRYLRHRSDGRERLVVEFESLQFLWGNGLRCVPQPIREERVDGCALYEYVEGEKIPPEKLTASDIDEAVRFLNRLKELRENPESRRLPPASEACFSAESVAQAVSLRLQRLRGVSANGPSQGALREFLEKEVVPSFIEVRQWSREFLEGEGLSFTGLIPGEDRTLSPSDFGFHNALRRRNGQMVFLDFEYFGWDDPAKLIADFLLHPGMGLTEGLRHRFASRALRLFSEQRSLSKRVRAVWPLCGFNWCLILLNEFLPGQRAVENSSAGGQLLKAKRMLEMVLRDYEHSFP